MRALDVLPDTADQLRAAQSYLADLLTPTVRLGVTGLARSGKTVFITALVRNLTSGGRLPFFAADAQGRILRVYLEPQPDDDVPRFDYEWHIDALTGPDPSWPDSTRRISQLRLTFEYLPANPLRRWLGVARLHLDIVDYPGEWLLDLALMGESYGSWSAGALALANEPARAAAAAPFLAYLANFAPVSPDPEATALAGAKLFTAYLKADRAGEEAQATLGPGRFLMPGELEGSPLLTFFPLPAPEGPGRASALNALLARRFESYKSKVVEPFFRDHFARLDRQIVLIDALGAINRGGAALAELERALTAIMTAFRPGAGSWLSFLTGARIDRLAFAATKADHLHHDGHPRLEAILRLATERAANRALGSGARVECMAVAAVRATREAQMTRGGETFPVILGVPVKGEIIDGRVFDGKTEAGIFPGDLPADPARAFDTAGARADDHAFVRFRPPLYVSEAATDSAKRTLPHIRLDRVIDFLIGDKLA